MLTGTIAGTIAGIALITSIRFFSHRSSSCLSCFVRMTFIGCVAPIQRIGDDSRTHSSVCATSTARFGEHSAVRSHSWRPSQKRTAWRASKPACASSLV